MRKRRNAEGTIRQSPDGRWEGRIVLGFRKGKRYRPSFYGKTEKEVRDQLDKARQQFKHGVELGADRERLTVFLKRWLEDTAKPRLRPRIFIGYKQHVDSHL